MEVDGEDTSLAALESLSTLLTAISESPFNEALHFQHVALAQSAGLQDELAAAREMLVSCLAATDDIWLPYLQSKVVAYESGQSTAAEVDEIFERAENDYFSIPIYKAHLNFLIHENEKYATGQTREPMFSTESVSEKAGAITDKAAPHMANGHEVWDAWMEWNSVLIGRLEGDERSTLLESMNEAYLERLATPHSTQEATFQAYSSFVSAHIPPSEYESYLVNASEVRQPAIAAWRGRDSYESSLTYPQAYSRYISFERYKSKPKKTGRGKKKEEPEVENVASSAIIATLYERAIAESARLKMIAYQGEGKGEITIEAAEAWLANFWEEYVSFLKETEGDETEVVVLSRAVRSVPSSGSLWAAYIRALESYRHADNIPAVFAQAINTGLLSPSAVSTVILARASYEFRNYRDYKDDESLEKAIEVLTDGIARVRAAGGDSSLKLEKFLVTVYMNMETPDDRRASEVWEDATKHYSKNWHVWTGFTDFLITTLKVPQRARKAFKDAQSLHLALDYPEPIFEAWIAFEQMWGSVKDLDYAVERVKKMAGGLAAKRVKTAQQAAVAEAQVVAEQTASLPVAAAPLPSVESATDTQMDVDVVPPEQEAGPSRKRKAEGDGDKHSTKKSKPDNEAPLKRDRENSTVFVGGLWAGAEEKDLRTFFKQCGEIREIKITQIDDEYVATVEFQNRDDVPTALTRDKKKIKSHELAVNMAWKSTLYITNFPEKTDDAAIRELFGQYGKIFDVRWPSKKFKSTRRFSYVQFTSPHSAESALALNGRELEPGLKMNVYISNPERKKERTDASADKKEIYVAGLSKFVKKEDLDKLFKTYGTITDIRMTVDQEGHSKGFAFIEFEQESSADKALSANNYELKKRRIAVTLADSRVTSHRTEQPASGLGRKNDLRSRSVRIKNLSPNTQEGLLQQALEKIAAVKKVEVFQDTGEAVVELESIAEAGKLLLSNDGIVFNERKLEISEEIFTRPQKKETTTTDAFVPRTALSKPRAGLGHKKAVGRGAEAPSEAGRSFVAGGSGESVQGGKGQDDFRKMLSGKR